jgi:hypothetical protein
MVLLQKIGDAIVRRAGGVDQRAQLGQGFDGHKDRTSRQRGAGRAIRHPHRNRRGLLVLLSEPDITAMPYAPLHDNRLPVQRMPRVMNRYLLSVVGRM